MRLKPSDRPSKIPVKLWDAKMRVEGYWSDGPNVVGALEVLIEYLIEEVQSSTSGEK